MSERADFLDLFGVNKTLLYCSASRGIVVNDQDHPFARIYMKPDGTVVLQAAEDIYGHRDDFNISLP
jgi:hypothetical protein